ncbi:MAG: type II CRISPR-associated endonuclease Cas1 [Alloprevotella sp.]|nr:type II CRISPR-associated endonuclease Cas1 [Alloprevotella sp.]MDY4568696.1 type II CRISPR-associated endonuclease Cas1 [Alloprevotella sp.]
MLKRTLVFANPISLSLKNSQLVLNYKDTPEANTTIPIEDVGVVVIEHQQVNITIPLLNALADQQVQVVICDSKGMPSAMLQNLDGNHLQGETLRLQMACGEVIKKQLWKQIIEAKIKNQSALLRKLGRRGELLKPYYQNVKSGDTDNREGAAARIYFQELFGSGFLRRRESPGINALLNYGYIILRAATARAIVSSGLLPAIGVFHHHRSNAFPLADDLMEPYRPYVDEIVFRLVEEEQIALSKEVKAQLLQVLYADTLFPNALRPLSIGLSFTTASFVRCLAKEQTSLALPTLQ